MPKQQPEELLASPPLIFCPPPRRTYDCLTDGDTDCVEPRRSSAPNRVGRRGGSARRLFGAGPAAEGRSSFSSAASGNGTCGSAASSGGAGTAAPKLKRRVSTQKHSKQDLQTQASSEDFSATYWQELNESNEDLPLPSGEDEEIELSLGDELEVEELFLDGEVPLQEVLLQDLKRQGTAAMRAFDTAMKQGTEPLQSVKLCLVGHARAGKTSTLRSLSGRTFDPNQESTHGVETKSCTLDKELWSPSTEETSAWHELPDGHQSVATIFEEKVAMTVADTMKAQASAASASTSQALDRGKPPADSSPGATVTAPVLGNDTVLMIQRAISSESPQQRSKEQVVVQTWDFAGQEMYYNMAHVFLTALGIYVLVLDLSAWRDATPLEKVESTDFWLAALLVHAKDAWLVIVGSHADAIDESMRQEVYQRLDLHLRKRLQHLKLLGNEAENLLFFPVDNQQNSWKSLQSIQHLRREVSALALDVCRQLPRIPTRWAHLFHLLEGLQEPCISLEQCGALADTLTMDRADLDLFLGLFHRLGQLLYFKGSPAVVLTPQWLLDAMAQVVACPLVLKKDPMSSKALREEGRLEKHLLEVLWKDPKFQGKELVLQRFLEHFDLIVPIDQDQGGWLVPSLLPWGPRKTIPLDQSVSVLLDFPGAFRRLLSTLIPRLLCQLRKRPVIAEIPFSEDWSSTLDELMKGRNDKNYDLRDRHGRSCSKSLDEDQFPLELRHCQALRVYKIFRDVAKFTLGTTLVTFELVPRHQPEVMRVEVGSKDAIFLKDVLASLRMAIRAWLPEVSYSTGLPCPCGVVQSGHFLELKELLKEETAFCDHLEQMVLPRLEEQQVMRQWRQLERGSAPSSNDDCSGRGTNGNAMSTPKPMRAWHFMYASPLEFRGRRVTQLSISQELKALPSNLPWQVALATPRALLEALQEHPLVLHLSAHSLLVTPRAAGKSKGEQARRSLLLEDLHSAGELLEIEELVQLGPWQEVGLLVLLSCHSKQLVELLNCRCAVCCTEKVQDSAAREFCGVFYKSLAAGAALRHAFAAARHAVKYPAEKGFEDEAKKFCLFPYNDQDLPITPLASPVPPPSWPRHSRVEDFRCQASQMQRIAKCLSNGHGHRRVMLLLGVQGAGKTATCREFCHHFAGPGRLFSQSVQWLDGQELLLAPSMAEFLSEAHVQAMQAAQALRHTSATRESPGLSLLVIDNLHIFEDPQREELRLALEGALRLSDSLRLLLTSRCDLGGAWHSLEHGKIVSETIETLPCEDAAHLFLKRCNRALKQEDFEAEEIRNLYKSLGSCGEPLVAGACLEGACAQKLLTTSKLLKVLDGVPGRIIHAAARVDDNLLSLLKHPALYEFPI